MWGTGSLLLYLLYVCCFSLVFTLFFNSFRVMRKQSLNEILRQEICMHLFRGKVNKFDVATGNSSSYVWSCHITLDVS